MQYSSEKITCGDFSVVTPGSGYGSFHPQVTILPVKRSYTH
jgi:hypothetical protein